MSFLDLFIKKVPENKSHSEPVEERSSWGGYVMYNSMGAYQENKALLLSAAYRCTEIISDSLSCLPVEPYKIDKDGYKSKYLNHPTYNILNKEPNKRMSRFTFIKTLVTSVLLTGNGYAYIQRGPKGVVKALHFLLTESVTIIYPKTIDDEIRYHVVGVGEISSRDMIHITQFSYDGITGVSVLRHAYDSLSLASDAEANATGFFRGGGNLSGTLSVAANLTKKQKEELKASWTAAFSGSNGTPNGVAVLEAGMVYTPISVSPADSQLLETREFNVIEICRFFGVNPVKVFDLSKSSYSTVEAVNLSFLTDTLQPIIEKFELEFTRKLYWRDTENIEVKFNTAALLRSDKTAQAEFYKEMFNIGSMTINEIRREMELPPLEDGDNSFVAVNLQTLDKAVNNPVAVTTAQPQVQVEQNENPDNSNE